MKGRDLHPRLLYPAKLSFRMKGQIKSFPDKVKLKEFIIIKPLNEMLKDLSKKKKNKTMNNKRQQTHNYEQLNLKNQKQTKQTTRTGTESQKWKSHRGLSTGEWEGERGGKGTENK